eukprot:7074101-Prorocentrum_lima.AAC.1
MDQKILIQAGRSPMRADPPQPHSTPLRRVRIRQLLSEIEVLKIAKLSGRALRVAQERKLKREGDLRRALGVGRLAGAADTIVYCTWLCGNPLCGRANDAEMPACCAPRCARPRPPCLEGRFQAGWRSLLRKRWQRAA